MNFQYKLGVPKEIRWEKRGGNKGEERRERMGREKEREGEEERQQEIYARVKRRV